MTHAQNVVRQLRQNAENEDIPKDIRERNRKRLNELEEQQEARNDD